MDVLEFATPCTGSSLEKIHDLNTQLVINITTLDALNENIERLTLITPEDIDTLENLYQKEFLLYMNNIAIYDDLMNYLDAEPRTEDNELELARIERDAYMMLRVESISL